MKNLVLVAMAAISMTACASISAGSTEMTLEEGAQEVCRSVTVSGTILPKRVCHNKATWAELEERDKERAQEQMRHIHDRYTPAPKESGM